MSKQIYKRLTLLSLALMFGCNEVESKDEIESKDRNENKNPNISERIVSAESFGGRYSLHEYKFNGTGEPHPQEILQKYDISSELGPDISCEWSVPWPEQNTGLSRIGLKLLKRHIINDAFGANFYEFEEWKAPQTIEAVEAEFKQLAWDKLTCKDFTNESAHVCSRWCFEANAELAWPFGLTGGTNWYERPVVTFKNSGYSNDGGNGCHAYVSSRVLLLPDCQELEERDFFREDSLNELFDLVLNRLLRDNELTVEDTLEKDLSKIVIKPGELQINVSKQGMTWWVSAYHIFPGCCGVTSVTIPWSELARFALNKH